MVFSNKVKSSVLNLNNVKRDLNLITPISHRNLDGDGENDENEEYDYYDINNATLKLFDGYAFKFGKCQKIQRFSDKAVQKGLYSSVVTDDIVVFRLCPERRCSASVDYGCTAGYGEYAMDLTDYLRTMMYYQQDKMQNLCMFCTACQYGNRRNMEEDEDEEQENAYQNYNKSGYQYNYYYNGDGYAADDDNSNSYFSSSDTCSTYSNICSQYASSCNNGEYQDGADYLNYLDYFDCTKVEYQNVYYYIKPTCDTSNNNEIVMGVFYDPFCSQYAGNDITINKVAGISFSKDVFTHASEQDCIACDYNVSSILQILLYFR